MISHASSSFKYPDYISALPADEFIKLAEKKQQLYDEGLAQVRNTLDQYSALRNNIVTDAEREYYDTAMTKLVKQVNSNAGIDFSYKSNVDAVLNMGQYIERDDNILTAISNGKEIRRRQTELSKMDSKKRSAANDFFFMDDAQKFLSSGKVGQKISYGKTYEEYYDLTEKWNDFMKSQKITPSQTSISAPGQKTGYGDAYLLKRTEEGYSEADIASRFRSFLQTDPKAMRQLQIDSQYNLNRLGKDNAYQGYVEYNQTIAADAATKAQQQAELVAAYEEANTKVPSATTQAQLEQAKQNLQYFEQVRVKANENVNKPYDQFDIQEYSQIYQDKFIANMGNQYAAKKVTDDLIGNKYWEEQQKNNRVYLQHNLALERERAKIKLNQEINYLGTAKNEVVVPQMNTVIKAVATPEALSQLVRLAEEARKDFSDPMKAAASNNLIKFTQEVGKLADKSGVAQLEGLEKIIKTYLGSNKLNYFYKPAVAKILGFKNATTPADYDNAIAQALNQINSMKTFVQNEKAADNGVSKPFSFSNSFDYSLGSVDNLNFFMNSGQLTDRYAVGLPSSIGYTTKPAVDPTTGKVIPGQEITTKNVDYKNTVNKGPKFSSEVDISSLGIE
jgi:hypothetical protein